jgi:hypothetical protein
MTTFAPNITPNIKLDIAVIEREYSVLQTKSMEEHIVSLDTIDIELNSFKTMFYQTNDFKIPDNEWLNLNTSLKNKLSLSDIDRKINNGPFRLFDTIIQNIETDLNISRDSLGLNTIVNLNKNISSIKTLCDLSDSNKYPILYSMKWSDILSAVTKQSFSSSSVAVILSISIIFISQNPDIKNTIVKMNYKTTIVS